MQADLVLDYYFAPMSGYAYLGHARFLALAAQAGAVVRYHPVDMAQVFAAAGSLAPAKYPQLRQHHRQADMLRWARALDLPLNVAPDFWPVPMMLACQVVMAAREEGMDQGAVAHAILAAVWVHDLDISDPAGISRALALQGLDEGRLLDAAQSPIGVAAAKAVTEQAIAAGIFGSPTYVHKDNWFFGQDRLDHLSRHLDGLRRAVMKA